MTTKMTTLETRTRVNYLDNLRVVLTALVVLHHAAVTYSHIPLWYYTSPPRTAPPPRWTCSSRSTRPTSWGSSSSSRATSRPGAVDRKGVGRFVRDRLVRLGIPLLLFVVVVRAVVGIPGWSVSGLPYAEYYVLSWDPGPTWFLEVLLAFSLVYAAVRRPRPTPRPAQARPLRGRWIVAFVAGLAVVTVLWRLVVPNGTYVPVLGLPTPGYLPQYAAMFTVGAGLPAGLAVGLDPAGGPVGRGRRGGRGPVRPARVRAGQSSRGSRCSRPCSPQDGHRPARVVPRAVRRGRGRRS